MMGSLITSTTQPSAVAETTLTPVTSPYTAAIALVKDSIVGVNNYQIVNYSNYGNGYGYGFPWGDFFGYGYGNGNNGNNNRRSEEVEYGSGSGVVVAEHYVLTNYHVVEDASSLKVVINSDDDAEPELLEATVAASDSDLDVAVLYVPDLKLSPVTLGDSDALQVGDYVFNIGNPLGFTNTVTAGIVSALNREISTGSTTDRYGRKSSIVNTMIQTDAAINSGNSGGGMFNLDGQLVGIPTLKYTGSRYPNTATVESIGMAIPVNSAKPVIEEALKADVSAFQGGQNGTGSGSADAGNARGDLSGKPRMGVTITTALVSALTGRPVRQNVAMTGEITLRGRVLPIGGVKEKLLAAYRAGIRTVILPRENEKDLEEIPEHVLKSFTILFADTVTDVLGTALLPKE